ncbi:hypothetical protein [Nocardia goodfellowii]|nr:hypothetical protein [Nocardia goodfellowii]
MTPDPLRAWHDRIYFLLLGLGDIDLKDSGIRLDHSRRSLAELEPVLLERFATPGHLSGPMVSQFVAGMIAYIGESLMRVAGGQWVWGPTRSASDGPVASADPVLELTPVAPIDLLSDVVTDRSGNRLTETYDRWAHAVEVHRHSNPSWQPEKQRTMADPPAEDTDAVRVWLTEQEAEFPAWVTEYGAGFVWDFDPASLAAVEDVLRRNMTVLEELAEPQHRRLRDGAAWYVGETFRRRLGGRWLKLGRAGKRNFPMLKGLGSRQTFQLTPVLALETALQTPGSLSKRFATVAEG